MKDVPDKASEGHVNVTGARADSTCPGEHEWAEFIALRLAYVHESPKLDPSVTAQDDTDSAAFQHLDTCTACRKLYALLMQSDSSHSREHEPRALLASPRDFALSRGTQLQRYTIIELVAQGGMGQVYRAYDPDLDRRVAVKLLRPDARAGRQDQLAQEAQVLAKISHPNVVTIFDVGRVDGRVFLAMEWLSGETLAAWLTSKPPIAAIIEAMLQLGSGLAAIHAAGLVHRDVKPSNVMFGDDHKAQLVDFGLSTAPLPPDSAPVAASDRAGTPAYMSPEQRAGAVVDARSDQYSFCVSLHEALFGSRPRTLDSAELELALASLGASRREKRALRRVLVTGLAETPRDRFASMDELLEVLDAGRMSRPKLWLVSAAVICLASIALVFILSDSETQPDCAKAGAEIDQYWRPAHELEMRRSYAAIGGSDWQRSYQSALDRTREWILDWKNERILVCRDTLEQGVSEGSDSSHQPSPASRLNCLEEQLETFKALSKMIRTPDDPDQLRGRGKLLDTIPRPKSCREADEKVPRTDDEAEYIEQLFKQAMTCQVAFRLGEQDKARRLSAELMAASKGYPEVEPSIYYLRAKVLAKDKQYEDSEELLLAAITATRGDKDIMLPFLAWTMLVELAALTQNLGPVADARIRGAEAAAAKVKPQSAHHGSLYYRIGVVRILQNRPELALAPLEKSATFKQKANVGPAAALVMLGQALSMLGRHEEAETHFRDAKKLAQADLPTWPAKLILHGRARFWAGDIAGARVVVAEALTALDKLVDAQGQPVPRSNVYYDRANAYTLLAIMAAQQHDCSAVDHALEHADAALEYDATNRARFALGLGIARAYCHLQKGQASTAERLLRELLVSGAVEPAEPLWGPMAKRLLAAVYRKLGQAAHAEALETEAAHGFAKVSGGVWLEASWSFGG